MLLRPACQLAFLSPLSELALPTSLTNQENAPEGIFSVEISPFQNDSHLCQVGIKVTRTVTEGHGWCDFIWPGDPHKTDLWSYKLTQRGSLGRS